MEQETKQINPYTPVLPYLSILPLTEAHLDLTVLDKLEEGYSQLIREYLLQEIVAPSVTVHLPPPTKKDKEKIAFLKAIRDTFESFKTDNASLCIGYPLVVWEDKEWEKTIAAPLFLWEVTVEEDLQNPTDWVLSSPNQKGRVNTILKSYLANKFGIEWETAIGLVSDVEAETINEKAQKVAELLGIDYANDTGAISTCPNPYAAIKEGVFNHLVMGHLSSNVKEKENKKPLPKIGGRPTIQWRTKVAALPTTADQNELIGTLFEGHHIVAECEAKSGKTQSIASVLASVLVDNGNVLIVTPQASSVKEIEAALKKMKLEATAITLYDEELDKIKLINKLKQLPTALKKIKVGDSADYAKKLNKHKLLRTQLESAYDGVSATVFKDWSWSETVGQFLHYQQQVNKQVINRKLDTTIFDWSENEYEKIGKELVHHYQYYKKINQLNHPLNALHGRFFDGQEGLEPSKVEAGNLINVHQYKIKQLYHDYLAWVDDYAETLRFERVDFAEKLEQKIDKINNDLHLYQDLYGDAFDKQSGLQNVKLKLLSFFSRKHQEIIAAKEQLLADFEVLKSTFEAQQYFNAKFPDIHREHKLADIEGKLEQFRVQLIDWKDGVAAQIYADTELLGKEGSKGVLLEDFIKEQELLDVSLEELIKKVNDAKILREPLEYKKQGIHQDTAFLLNLHLQFQKLEYNWTVFDDYYNWRMDWIGSSKETQTVVKTLVSANVQNWEAGFKSWYLYHVLERGYTAQLPTGNLSEALPYESYGQNLIGVQQKIAEKALRITQERQLSQIRRLKKEKDITLTNAAPIFSNKTLPDIVGWLGVEHIGEFFPIIVASPELAITVLQSNVAVFDLIIVDDADQLPSKEAITLLKLANQRIVLGQPVVKEEEESMLTWMLAESGRRYQYLKTTEKEVEEENATPAIEAIGKRTALQKAIVNYLEPYISRKRIETAVQVEGMVADVLIHPEDEAKKPLVIICDGSLHYQGKYDFKYAVERQQYFKSKGYLVRYAWSVDWWKNTKKALQPLLAAVLEWDNENG